MVIVKDGTFDATGYDDVFSRFSSFELSDFQKWACKAIADGNHPIRSHLQLGNEAGLCDARAGARGAPPPAPA